MSTKKQNTNTSLRQFIIFEKNLIERDLFFSDIYKKFIRLNQPLLKEINNKVGVFLNLENKINLYRKMYYSKNISKITDAEYDNLLERNICIFKEITYLYQKKIHRLEEFSLSRDYKLITDRLKKELSKIIYYNHVGWQAVSYLEKVTHLSPVLSLTHVRSFEDLIKFFANIRKTLKETFFIPVFSEVKIDGISLVLLYEKGKIIHGLTRGDGKIGEDITHNILSIKNIPKKIDIKDKVEIRGEAFISKKNFAELNKKNLEFSNPRNSVSGILRKKETSSYLQFVSFYAYDIRYYYNKKEEISDVNKKRFFLKYQHTIQEKLKENRFPTDYLNHQICFSEENVRTYCEKVLRKKASLEYETDGIVFKVDNLDLQERLGENKHAPRWAIAYKYDTLKVRTKILEIFYQISRFGKITPLARVQKVFIQNVEISKASLHNFNYIQKKDIRLGDTVLIERAGSVIPQIVCVVKEKRARNLKKYEIIKECPFCYGKVTRSKKQNINECFPPHLFCLNDECKEVKIMLLVYFSGKTGIDIKGMGIKKIRQLHRKNILNEYADFFKLTKLPNSYNLNSKLMHEINNKKNITITVFFKAISIPNIGEVIAKELDLFFENKRQIKEFMNNIYTKRLNRENINIPLISKIILDSLINFFTNRKNFNRISNLLSIINLNSEQKTKKKLSGKTIAFIGNMKKTTKKEAVFLISKLGGKVVSAETHKIDFLVVEKNYRKKNLGFSKKNIKIFTEEEWINYIK